MALYTVSIILNELRMYNPWQVEVTVNCHGITVLTGIQLFDTYDEMRDAIDYKFDPAARTALHDWEEDNVPWNPSKLTTSELG